ncbi:unnamed protein product [Caenorhabditis auriculariae]|uniref:Uncharacterized protein n=1 Tax=Caenorhabditis auriculariae TaxID=2777116 RepID=A0A8S1GY17_9PELO|nr:unnamed protein product [Caenorhabditis auriculariae]
MVLEEIACTRAIRVLVRSGWELLSLLGEEATGEFFPRRLRPLVLISHLGLDGFIGVRSLSLAAGGEGVV